jgi:hypothetical protein
MKRAAWMFALGVVAAGCGSTGPCDEIIGTATIEQGFTKADAEAQAAERTGQDGWSCTVSASDEVSGAWIVWTCERCD